MVLELPLILRILVFLGGAASSANSANSANSSNSANSGISRWGCHDYWCFWAGLRVAGINLAYSANSGIFSILDSPLMRFALSER